MPVRLISLNSTPINPSVSGLEGLRVTTVLVNVQQLHSVFLIYLQ